MQHRSNDVILARGIFKDDSQTCFLRQDLLTLWDSTPTLEPLWAPRSSVTCPTTRGGKMAAWISHASILGLAHHRSPPNRVATADFHHCSTFLSGLRWAAGHECIIQAHALARPQSALEGIARLQEALAETDLLYGTTCSKVMQRSTQT